MLPWTGFAATFCLTTPSMYSSAGFCSGRARNSSSVIRCPTHGEGVLPSAMSGRSEMAMLLPRGSEVSSTSYRE